MARSFELQFRAALAQVNGGRLEEAAAACDGLRREHPDDPAVLQLHATIALRTGRPGDALDSIRRSLALRPGHVPSLILAAEAARANHMPAAAVGPLREAVARAPDRADAAFLLSRTLLDLDDPELGIVLEQTAQRHPGAASEWQQLGVALRRGGKAGAALAAFTRAAAADPGLAAAAFGIGLLLRDGGRISEARSALERAVALDPTASGAWFALGLTYQDIGDDERAVTAFQAALRERPGFAEAAVNLGIALQQQGRMDDAIEAYRDAVRIRPDTIGRIAQAVTAARTGMLWLDLGAFRRALGA
jgi:tetratricopeptide (TPR) repeat protein